ncbi:spore germination protein GerPC [Radiobacillus kanasensis]|uniref:spore germination protein GerPC n=1 Tax=Radiobacillus kanasensis TaxID=2844358 RepID=UPI001E3822EE|nr:spore germination protein GerPC [Radiobacillus kanasensis]UFU00526.1 spore germination protein GerPC [Radiobacillus kanasensis]
MHYYNWNDYLQQMRNHLNTQEKRIQELEKRVLEFEESNKNQTIVEKLEYNFDQLKIERLDGTLHIGLSPEELSSMDPSAVQLPHNPIVPFREKQVDPLIQTLNTYASQELPNRIQQLSQDYQVSVNDHLEKEIIEDIRKQFPSRLDYYKREHQLSGDTLFQTLKQEVDHSLQQFFIQEAERGGNDDEFGGS